MIQEENSRKATEDFIINDIVKENNISWRTNRKIIKEFCEKNLAQHTDWTGTRIETKFECESVEKFVDILMEHIEDNHYKC